MQQRVDALNCPSPPRTLQLPYLGRRAVDRSGTPGGFEWMSYKEAGEARTAIGAGMVHLGIQPGSMVGIYSINSVGEPCFFPLILQVFKKHRRLPSPSFGGPLTNLKPTQSTIHLPSLFS